MAQRARQFYRRAGETLPAVDRRNMIAAELMGAVYWRLLGKLEKRRFNVFDSEPCRVSRPEKLLLILRTWYRVVSGSASPNYGIP